MGNVERSLWTNTNPIGQGRQDGGAVTRETAEELRPCHVSQSGWLLHGVREGLGDCRDSF